MHQIGLILLITGFTTGFLSTWIGLLLVNIKPVLSKVLLVALFYGIVNMVVRSYSMPFGVHFLILTCVLYILIMVSWRFSFFKALVPTIMGMLVLILCESFYVSLIVKILRQSIPGLMEGWEFLHVFLPEVIMVLILIALIDRFDFHIFDFTAINPYTINNRHIFRFDLVTVLTGLMLVLLILQFLLNISIIYVCPSQLFQSISLENAGVLNSVLMISIFVLMVLIISQLLALSRKENEYLVQLSYHNTLDELHTAVRAENHDRINHLQTLYGFLQLGNLNETKKYLEELMGDTIISQHYAVKGNPALSALLYIKSGIATSQGIQLNLDVNGDVARTSIPSYELNRIVGNLINNAFDAVVELDKANRWVAISINEKGENYVFKVCNYGNIDKSTAQNIFFRDYSTKGGRHKGLGLYIVKHLAEKHGGQISLENNNNVVEFTVILPRSRQGWEIDEFSGSKTGPGAGRELRSDV